MGGYSGGRPARIPTIEGTHALVLDMLRVMRPFARALGRRAFDHDVTLPPFAMTWQRDGEPWCVAECSITIHPGGDGGTLRLRHADPHGWGHPPQDYVVTLDTTCPPYGGRQWWFLCPATGRRCRKMFLPNGGRRFLCRQAYRLGYHSRRTTRSDRMQRRIGKLCRRLGGEWSVWACDLPAKPKWMRWRTYERMQAKALEAQGVVDDAFCGLAERFAAQRS